MPTDLPLVDLLGLAYAQAAQHNDPDLAAVLDAITDRVARLAAGAVVAQAGVDLATQESCLGADLHEAAAQLDALRRPVD